MIGHKLQDHFLSVKHKYLSLHELSSVKMASVLKVKSQNQTHYLNNERKAPKHG